MGDDAYKPVGWRIHEELRRRLVSFAKRKGKKAEYIVNKWLEQRLRQEERKLARQLGKPIL